MASNMSYAPVLPRIDWSSRNLAEEFHNLEDMVDLMWTGPSAMLDRRNGLAM